MVVMMVFLTFWKMPWQVHIPFPCIIAVSVKANLESLMTVRTAHSPLHSSAFSWGVPTNFFLPNFNLPDPSVTLPFQGKRWKMSFPQMATWWLGHFMKMRKFWLWLPSACWGNCICISHFLSQWCGKILNFPYSSKFLTTRLLEKGKYHSCIFEWE